MATPAERTTKHIPTVALVGRVNVGKSTLFNRLTEEQKAIISDIPGTTRTSNEGLVVWRGTEFRLIDTGGLSFVDDVPLEEQIIAQTERALIEADMVVFVTDVRDGILPQEQELARRLREKATDTPVLVVANKVDNQKKETHIDWGGYAKLQLGDPFPISGASGHNLGDLLDVIYDKLASIAQPAADISDDGNDIMRVSIIGKPNVGKSSLFNKIIGEDRVIVSEMAHTTREPYDTDVIYEHTAGDETIEQHITFVDTAGIRRKSRVSGQLERLGIHKSLQVIDKSDIVLFVLDGSADISHQDKQLGGLLERRAKSVMILINKWDLTEDVSDTERNAVKKMVYYHFPHLDFAPIHFVSGKTGYRVHQIFPELMRMWQSRQTYIANRGLEKFLEQITKEHLPARGKGTRHPKLLGFRQLATAPPVFELFVKEKTSLHSSYLNFIENKLRERFDFYGSPIIIRIKKIGR